MPVNLTKTRARLNNIKRKLYYGKEIFTKVRFLNINTVLLEVDTGWNMPDELVNDISSGQKYYNFYIADAKNEWDLDSVLDLSTSIEIDGKTYKFVNEKSPLNLTKQYHLRVLVTGESK
jgi:hypothetical protein